MTLVIIISRAYHVTKGKTKYHSGRLEFSDQRKDNNNAQRDRNALNVGRIKVVNSNSQNAPKSLQDEGQLLNEPSDESFGGKHTVRSDIVLTIV